MNIQSGKFKCPKCGNNKVWDYDEWQNNGFKWIFHNNWNNGTWYWWEILNGCHPDARNHLVKKWKKTARACWKYNGGLTIESWNYIQRNQKKCLKCNYNPKSFVEFIPNFNNDNKINKELNNELNNINAEIIPSSNNMEKGDSVSNNEANN